MVRKIVSQLSALVILIACLSACSKPSEYTYAIPADATAVLSIDLKALAEKSGVNDAENEALKQKVLDALKDGINATAYQHVEKIIKNPVESGIDVKAPLYAFTSPTLSYVVVAKVDNEKNLQATLDVLVKEQICLPVEEASGFSYTFFNGNIVAFNKSTALLLGAYGNKLSKETQNLLSGLLKQDAENSLAKNAGFKKMLDRKGDFKFFASMNAIPEVYARQINFGLPQGIELKDLMMLGNLSFEKGKITARFENYTENEEVKELMKKQEKAMSKLNGAFLKYFPASTLGILSIGANGEEFYKLLLENKEFRDQVSLAEADDIKAIANAFKGDITIGLLDVGVMSSEPGFVAYAEVKEGNTLQALYENKQALSLRAGEDIIKLGENEYLFKGRSLRLFYGVKNDQMYVTNNEMVYKNIFKAVDGSIKDLEFTKEMKGKNVFFAINMDAILELPAVKMVAGFGGEEVQMYLALASAVSYLECTGETNGETTISLCLKNKDVNALKQMVDFGRHFAGM